MLVFLPAIGDFATAQLLGSPNQYMVGNIISNEAATPGGFWTPATIFGDRLIQRLTARSGVTFDLVPESLASSK